MTYVIFVARDWRSLRLVAMIACSIVVLDFCRSSVARAQLVDFHVLCNATRVWLAGGDPFCHAQTAARWTADGGAGVAGTTDGQIVVYPPTAFPLIAALGLTSPKVSGVLWLIVQSVSVVALLLLAVEAARLWGSLLAIAVFATVALAWSPLRMAVYHGQPALPAAAMVLAAYVVGEKRRDGAAGLLLGLAVALKPHMAMALVAFWLLRKRWASLGIALAFVVLCGVIGAGRMEVAGHAQWFMEWSGNLYEASHNGNSSDVAFGNGTRFDIINLQVLLYTLWPSRNACDLGAIAITGLGVVVLLWRVSRRSPYDNLLTFCCLCALSLLPVYHRTPDMCLLIPVAAWAVSVRPPLAARLLVGVAVLPMFFASETVNCLAVRYLPLDTFHAITGGFRSASGLLVACALVTAMEWAQRSRREPEVASQPMPDASVSEGAESQSCKDRT